jgi:hypothetical protein
MSLGGLADNFTNDTPQNNFHAQHHNDLADAINELASGILSGTAFNVMDYGAVGDGTTDDTAAIQAALTAARAVGGTTFFPSGVYKANLSLRSGDRLVGVYPDLVNATLGSIIQAFNNSLDTIKVDQGAGNFQQNIYLENLTIKGGANGFATYRGIAYLTLKNISITGATGAAFYMEDWLEEVDFEMVRLVGSQYGFRHAGNGSGLKYIDKASFKQLYLAGNTKNGWNTICQFDAVTWDQMNVTSNGEHGFVIDGPTNALVFIGVSTESNGTSGKKNRTTGSITSGTPTLTVASATGYAIGDVVTVKNANGFNGDLTANVTNVVGTTVTLDANATATVSSVPVTNAKWDDFVFTNVVSGGNGPGRIAMIAPYVGGEGATGRLRYSINASRMSSDLTIISGATFAGMPVYDPLRVVILLGKGNVALRRPTLMNGWDFRGLTVGSDAASEPTPAVYGGHGGQDTIFGLPDSVGNGGGTFGKWSWRTSDPNKTERMALDTNGLTITGGISDKGIANVLTFGAKGDGTTDDTTAIQAAINSLPVRGGTVYFPPGDYRISAALTFPTGNLQSNVYETHVVLRGAGPQATRIRRSADVIMIDASGSISAGTVSMRRGVTLENLTVDGNSSGTQPLVRYYYAFLCVANNCWFMNSQGPLVKGVQFWDSRFVNCWFSAARGTTLSVDPAYNSGTGIWGHEAVQLTSVGATGLTNSQMGYSTDNVNNIWFTNCNFTENCAGDIYMGQMGGSSAPNKCNMVNSKFECIVGAVGPRIRAYTAQYFNMVNANFLVGGYGSGIGSVDVISLVNTVSSNFQNFLFEQGAVPVATAIKCHAGCNNNGFDNIVSLLNTGGTGTAPNTNALTSIIGQYTTASGQYGADKVFAFESTSSNVRIGRHQEAGSLGFIRDNNTVGYQFNSKGGTSTQTPGAVTTVNIPHSMGIAPNSAIVQPGDANARGAPAFFITWDATNIILNFVSALTAATSYTWRWVAT